jgi:hypothetical protein
MEGATHHRPSSPTVDTQFPLLGGNDADTVVTTYTVIIIIEKEEVIEPAACSSGGERMVKKAKLVTAQIPPRTLEQLL